MSVLTGDPRGFVVFVQQNVINVVRRDALVAATVDVYGAGAHGLVINVFGCQYSFGSFPIELAWQMYSSIINEDTDVVWTELRDGQWIRTPDDVDERWRRVLPAKRASVPPVPAPFFSCPDCGSQGHPGPCRWGA